MNLLFDTSIWVDHFRRGVLEDVIPRLRGKFVLWFDAITGAELLAGCRSKEERRVVAEVLRPFEKAERLAVPIAADFRRAATALSKLRERGHTLKKPGSALLDALIASVAHRKGALLVTSNETDFEMLRSQLPFAQHDLPALLKLLHDA